AGELLITKNLTIQRLGADHLTINGSHSDRIFEITSGVTANISGLTITNGRASSGGHLVANGTVFYPGGGIFSSGTLCVTDCTISGNTVPQFYLPFSGNTGSTGGAVYNALNATMTIRSSVLSGNTAPLGFGGAIFNQGTMIVESVSTLSSNSATFGGGI